MVDLPLPTVRLLGPVLEVKFSLLNGMVSDSLVPVPGMLMTCGPLAGIVITPSAASCGWKASNGGVPISEGRFEGAGSKADPEPVVGIGQAGQMGPPAGCCAADR